MRPESGRARMMAKALGAIPAIFIERHGGGKMEKRASGKVAGLAACLALSPAFVQAQVARVPVAAGAMGVSAMSAPVIAANRWSSLGLGGPIGTQQLVLPMGNFHLSQAPAVRNAPVVFDSAAQARPSIQARAAAPSAQDERTARGKFDKSVLSKQDMPLLDFLESRPDLTYPVRFVTASGKDALGLARDHGLIGREGWMDNRASLNPGVELRVKLKEALLLAADPRVEWVSVGDPGWGYDTISDDPSWEPAAETAGGARVLAQETGIEASKKAARMAKALVEDGREEGAAPVAAVPAAVSTW